VGQALVPRVLKDQLQVLVDALEPERLQDVEAEAYDERALRLRTRRGLPGWRMTADADGRMIDENGWVGSPGREPPGP
jgi:hypothetical protein